MDISNKDKSISGFGSDFNLATVFDAVVFASMDGYPIIYVPKTTGKFKYLSLLWMFSSLVFWDFDGFQICIVLEKNKNCAISRVKHLIPSF